MDKKARELLQRIHEDASYAERVKWIREIMQDAAELLDTEAINLAASGVWKEWSESKPDGETITFDPQDLLNCGDRNVEGILHATSALKYIRAHLTDEAPEDRDGEPGNSE
jgi:hypothetical protein